MEIMITDKRGSNLHAIRREKSGKANLWPSSSLHKAFALLSVGFRTAKSSCLQIRRDSRVCLYLFQPKLVGYFAIAHSKISQNQIMLAIRTFVRRLSSEKSFNRVTLIGRVGSDAQLKGTFEHPVVIFSVATSSPGSQKTEWHKISVFKPGLRQIAENYVKSGSRLFVEGKLSYGHIIDNQGNAVPATSIIAEDIMFLGSKSSERQGEPMESEATAESN